jgi:hypothetical protein
MCKVFGSIPSTTKKEKKQTKAKTKAPTKTRDRGQYKRIEIREINAHMYESIDFQRRCQNHTEDFSKFDARETGYMHAEK